VVVVVVAWWWFDFDFDFDTIPAQVFPHTPTAGFNANLGLLWVVVCRCAPSFAFRMPMPTP